MSKWNWLQPEEPVMWLKTSTSAEPRCELMFSSPPLFGLPKKASVVKEEWESLVSKHDQGFLNNRRHSLTVPRNYQLLVSPSLFSSPIKLLKCGRNLLGSHNLRKRLSWLSVYCTWTVSYFDLLYWTVSKGGKLYCFSFSWENSYLH